MDRRGVLFLALGKGMLMSWAVTGVFLLLLSGLLLGGGLSEGVAGGMLIAVYVLSPFAGGFYVSKWAEEKKFLWGSLLGILYFTVYGMIAVLASGDSMISILSLIRLFFLQLLGGTLGGMIRSFLKS